MAVTASLYDHTVRLFADTGGGLDLTDLYVELLDPGAPFAASETSMDNVDDTGTQEVYGNQWDTGGMLLTACGVSIVTTNDAKLDAADITVTATGGAIGPADAAVIYAKTLNKPLVYIDFGEVKTADAGTDFKITWNASGIITWTYT